MTVMVMMIMIMMMVMIITMIITMMMMTTVMMTFEDGNVDDKRIWMVVRLIMTTTIHDNDGRGKGAEDLNSSQRQAVDSVCSDPDSTRLKITKKNR